MPASSRHLNPDQALSIHNGVFEGHELETLFWRTDKTFERSWDRLIVLGFERAGTKECDKEKFRRAVISSATFDWFYKNVIKKI